MPARVLEREEHLVRSVAEAGGGSADDIYSVRPSGAGLARLSKTGHIDEFSPRYFKGGIVFSRGQSGEGPGAYADIFTMRSNGTKVKVLVAGAGSSFVEDVAPAVLLFMGIGMLLVAMRQPQFAGALRPLVAGDWLRSPIGYVLLFGVASPLVLYRGPLNPFGVGIAIFTVLLTANVLPPVVLVAAVMAVVQVQNVCDPTNTANVWVANFTGVPIATITRRTLPYQTAVATVATLAVVLGSPALFGKPSFTSLYSVAHAGETLPGFYPPQSARGRIAIDDDGTSFGRAAADAAASALAGATWTMRRLHEDPNASDCSNKDYAAYLRVGSSLFALSSGDDLDVGLRLQDCGGWIVNRLRATRLPMEDSHAAID